MKKIFHFVSTNILGGLENMVLNISTLVNGYSYTYVSPNGIINDYLYHYGINHISIPNMNPVSVRNVIKKYHPDIVHGHDVKASLALACNAHLCHKNGIKIISQIHNDDPRMKKYLNIRSLLYALSTPFYDHVIMVSQPIYDNYVYNNLIRNKTTIIYNVINPYRIKDSLVNVSSDKKWDCIFVGRMVYQKDPLKFVKIIYQLKKKINNIRAVMVGDGNLLPKVKLLIKEYNLNNNITLVGFQKNPYKYMKHSKITIIPSIFEGFGLVALESLIVGIPVISSPVGGLKNVVDKKCGDFACSISKYSYIIQRLLNDHTLYNRKIYYALYKSKKINNIRKFSNLYKKIYSD